MRNFTTRITEELSELSWFKDKVLGFRRLQGFLWSSLTTFKGYLGSGGLRAPETRVSGFKPLRFPTSLARRPPVQDSFPNVCVVVVDVPGVPTSIPLHVAIKLSLPSS